METDRPVLLQAKDLVIARGNRRVVIGDFSLCQGDRLAIVGSNGSGKSTLCLAIAGLMKTASGKLYRSPVFPGLVLGYLPQSGGLYPHLTVAENISFLRRMFDDDEVFDPRFLPVLWTLGLGDVLSVPAQALSGGYFRLAALACVLCLKVQGLLLDEPMAGLDERHRGAAQEAIGEVAKQLKFLVVTAHRREDVGFCDRTLSIGGQAS